MITAASPKDPLNSSAAQGTGLAVRTMVAKFYVELAYGFLKTYEPGIGWGRATGTFNALIGTKSFDLWSRK
jgi:hypothetical protein